MRQNNTFLGYRIEDGRAVVHEKDAAKVRLLYKGYLSGLSYIDAAKSVGLELNASSVKMLMRNVRYAGDDFYPQIIDRTTFDAAESERLRRCRLLGKKEGQSKEKAQKTVPQNFSFRKCLKTFGDPFKQAEYIYSLIESEV
ncbi:hypothetical protein [Succinimonas amylolytica]|uniref:hypothetical protein n=1 Tax=Succinimonas amylolytica TaxID=83769 RepID=UPI00037AA01F|nr:hypothetical protein [Succinimonas amylolytica]